MVVLIANPVAAVEPADLSLGGGGGGWSFDATEKCFMEKVNRARRRNGLNGLGFDKQVGVVARRHAKSMANN